MWNNQQQRERGKKGTPRAKQQTVAVGLHEHKTDSATRTDVLPTRRIYVLCVDLRTNNNYFPTQH